MFFGISLEMGVVHRQKYFDHDKKNHTKFIILFCKESSKTY